MSLPAVAEDNSSKKYLNLVEVVKTLEKLGYTVVDSVDALTVPADAKEVGAQRKEKIKKSKRVTMTEDELDLAISKLVKKYPPVEKRYTDPPIPGQKVCLVSFQPSQNAKPDADGLYGYFKVRGVFTSEEEADAYGEQLLNTVDSLHPIDHGYVGHPLPAAKEDDDKYSLDVEHISFQAKLRKEMEQDTKQKVNNEKKQMEEIKKRAQKGKEKEEAIMRGEVDHSERYIGLRVKRANLIFSMYGGLKDLKKYKDTLIQTIGLIEKMDQEFPELRDRFLKTYDEHAKEVGIPTEKNYILPYLAGDVPFDLNIIPDKIKLDTVKVPEVEPEIKNIDMDGVNAFDIAQEMVEKSKKGLETLESFDKQKWKEGKVMTVEEAAEERRKKKEERDRLMAEQTEKEAKIAEERKRKLQALKEEEERMKGALSSETSKPSTEQ